jgi:hypothetical protein
MYELNIRIIYTNYIYELYTRIINMNKQKIPISKLLLYLQQQAINKP